MITALTTYLPYLVSLDAALSGRSVADEDIDIALLHESEVGWRVTLSTVAIPGRKLVKINATGLDYELHYTLHVLATLHYLVARRSLLEISTSLNSQPDRRLAAIQSATKDFVTAESVHAYLVTHGNSVGVSSTFPTAAVDISITVQAALADICRAETTLCFVLKDDPYPAIVAQSRDKDDREWMVKAPEIPKLRAQVLSRLCISAAERAGSAATSLNAENRVSKDFLHYCEDLRKTARAKACRFLGIDADIGGETGKAIAWLRAGMAELGADGGKNGARAAGLAQMKSSWSGRTGDKKSERGFETWGSDGGKIEEGRILDWLSRKLVKMNDTVNVQLVPDWKPLLATMPSGREILVTYAWIPPLLTEVELARMRAPPDHEDLKAGSDSSEDESDRSMDLVGAFTVSRAQYGDSANYY